MRCFFRSYLCSVFFIMSEVCMIYSQNHDKKCDVEKGIYGCERYFNKTINFESCFEKGYKTYSKHKWTTCMAEMEIARNFCPIEKRTIEINTREYATYVPTLYRWSSYGYNTYGIKEPWTMFWFTIKRKKMDPSRLDKFLIEEKYKLQELWKKDYSNIENLKDGIQTLPTMAARELCKELLKRFEKIEIPPVKKDDSISLTDSRVYPLFGILVWLNTTAQVISKTEAELP